MLTIQPISSSSAASYYTDIDNYYLSDKETLEQGSKWMGKGAEKLGLSGVVDPKVFLSLLEGNLPNGAQLGITIDGERKHRAGTDVTLSAPKSISLLALVGKDKRLLEAHHKAVKTVIDRIEKMAAEARITIKGETAYEKTNNLTIASFLHTSSRELEAQLHSHLAIMNMTERLDKQWRALSSRQKSEREHIYNGFREILYDNQHYFGLVYTSTLAKLTVEAGYDINITDQYGNFEVEGVDKKYIEANSTRSKQIKERLSSKGLTGSRAAEKAALDTRMAKQELSSEELDDIWQERAKSHKANLEQLIADSKSRDMGKGECKSEVLVKVSQTAVQAVSDALEHLSNYNAKVHHSDLVRQSFVFAAGRIAHEEIEHEIISRLKNKTLLGKENENYTTKTLLEKEQSFQKQIAKGNGKSFTLELKSTGIVESILKSKNRVQIVNVKGLRNEKEFLEQFVHIGDENKINTYVLHQTRCHTNRLRQTVSRDGSTFWKQIKNLFKDDITHTVRSFTNAYGDMLEGSKTSNRKDVIIIHDAQKLNYESISKLETLAAKSESKIVLLNNRKSTEGFFAGSPIKALVDNNISVYETQTKEQAYSCSIIKSKTAIEAVSQNYINNRNLNNKIAVVAVSKNSQKELTDNIRGKLKDNGYISYQEKKITVLASSTLSDIQKKHTKFYSPGDFIIRDPWTKAREKFTVVESKNNQLIVSDKNHNHSTIDLLKDKDFLVQKPKSLSVSVNEQVLLDANMYHEGKKFDKGGVGIVREISKDGVSIELDNELVILNDSELKNTSLSHSYVRRAHNINDNFDKILITAKPYQLSSELIGELSTFSEKIELFTEDATKAQNKLCRENINSSVDDTIKSHHKPITRDISHAVEAISDDIESLSHSLATEKFTLDKEKISRQAVSYAVAKCAERQAAFTHKELLTNALLFCIGKADFDDISPILEERIKSSNLKYLDTHWITQKELDIEKDILKLNEDNKGVMTPVLTDKNKLLDLDSRFTQGQKDAISLALTSTDRFITIQGLAGVGKTTMMKEVNKRALQHNVKVYGITPTNRARIELSETGIKTQTIESFLQNDQKLPKNSIIILDEASMVGSQAYRALQQKIISHDGMIISTGDMTQLQSLSAGIPHEVNVVTKSQKTAFMNDIVRQNPNPQLKEAAYQASAGKIALSHETISKIKSVDYVERDSTFEHETSIVEISPKKDEETKEIDVLHIHKELSKDFLSRTKECRDNTVVVIHANEDRETVNLLIREGLQEKNELESKQFITNRHVAKDMSEADLLLSESFSKNDILRFDKTFGFIKRGDYFRVIEHIKNSNDIKCVGSDGNSYVIDTKSREKGGLSVYENKPSPLSIGEKIRFKRSDLSKDRLANDSYIIKEIKEESITLHSKNSIQTLDLSKNNDLHWDYGYADTAFTIQGGTGKYCISLQLSGRTKSTTWRAMLIDQTRAALQHTSYTDNHKALITRTDDYKKQQETNKKSALQMYKSYQKNKVNLQKNLLSDEQNSLTRTIEKASYNISEYDHYNKDIPIESGDINSNYMAFEGLAPNKKNENLPQEIKHKIIIPEKETSIKEIEAQLKLNIKGLCHQFLGEPNKKLSNNNSLRYGAKGSLKVDISSGNWKDFESNEGGNCFELIKTQMGMSDFKDALSFAKDFLSIAPKITILRKEKSVKNQKNDNGMQKYAKILSKRSADIRGSVLEKYLKNTRGLNNYQHADIKYLDKISTYHKDKKLSVPALLAISYNEKNEVNHVQVTRLNRKESNKDKDSYIIKQTYGANNGHGVELNRNHKGKITYLTEGVETGLSILEVDKEARVVTVLGKSNFSNINLNRYGKNICFCLDNDGDKTLSNKDVNISINNAAKNGSNISVIIPDKKGYDLNDILLKEGVKSLKNTLNNKLNIDGFNEKITDFYKNNSIIDQKKSIKSHENINVNINEKANDISFEPSINKNISSLNINDYSKNPLPKHVDKGIEQEREL